MNMKWFICIYMNAPEPGFLLTLGKREGSCGTALTPEC
jgi:hypothetical protein